MKVFIIFAHPEPQSLNGALLRVTVNELESQGHEVQVSDLYAMQWKSQVDRADFPQVPADARLRVAMSSGEATALSTLTDDVKQEQEKLLWADTIILQFPLWWYAMPAILKGWVDRVFSYGFAYGVGEHSDKRCGDRFGEGKLFGKRAFLIVTIGGWREHYSPRGISGPIEDILFPITHGMLYYTGLEILPSFVIYQADRADDAIFKATSHDLRQRLKNLPITKPIAYRRQNGGDYELPSLTLRPGLEDDGAKGFSLHARITKDTAGCQ
ncbi:flavoprotein-like protein [Truncatella angustata]|uniref:Flavoprotein-like protein n=1 Tax=Truncatella angustata TaxID=152316 RepID=A0A9P8RNT9_9PEZI|nr:flavoprotein-like protein [Truncatella angustata]KAH6646586.1 flavoprotein-like protein [Truncatella angustata]